MDVVFGDVATDYLYLVCLTDLSDEIADSDTKPSVQDRLVVFRGPDEMVFAVKDRVGGLAIEFHLNTLSS
jgi:hypothetical protein